METEIYEVKRFRDGWFMEPIEPKVEFFTRKLKLEGTEG
jgi:hypothetical protein